MKKNFCQNPKYRFVEGIASLFLKGFCLLFVLCHSFETSSLEVQMLIIFALSKFGNSKLTGCEGFFNLDSPNTGGLFEGNQSFTSCFNAVMSFQKVFVASFGICDQR